MFAPTQALRDLLDTYPEKVSRSCVLGTWNKRALGLSRFFTFIESTKAKLGPPFFLNIIASKRWLPRAYALHLMNTVTASAMKNSITAVNTMYQMQGLVSPMKRADVTALLKAHQRVTRTPGKKMLGLEDFMIRQIADAWLLDEAQPQPARVMLLLFIYFARLGLLRGKAVLRIAWASIIVTKRGLHVCIDRTKMRQIKGMEADFPFTNRKHCLRKVFMAYLHACGGYLRKDGRVGGVHGMVFQPLTKVGNHSQYNRINYAIRPREPNTTHEVSGTKINTFIRAACVQVVGMTSPEADLISKHGGRITGYNAGCDLDKEGLARDIGDWRNWNNANGYRRKTSTARLETAATIAF